MLKFFFGKKPPLRIDKEIDGVKEDARKVALHFNMTPSDFGNRNNFMLLIAVLRRRCAPLDDTARAVFTRRFRWLAGLSLALAGYATSWAAYDHPAEAAGIGWLSLCIGLGAALIYVRLLPQHLELVGHVDPDMPRLPYQPPEILPPPKRED